jgi:hypothetical protein
MEAVNSKPDLATSRIATEINRLRLTVGWLLFAILIELVALGIEYRNLHS